MSKQIFSFQINLNELKKNKKINREKMEKENNFELELFGLELKINNNYVNCR